VLITQTIVLLSSCSFGWDKNTENTTILPPEIWAPVLQENAYTISSELDEKNQAFGIQTVFSKGVPIIYTTFFLSDNICCIPFRVNWYFEDQFLDSWDFIGRNDDSPALTTFLPKPETGYLTGSYHVEAFIELRKVFDFSFTIE
jgi:hypothetical protein